MNTVFNHISISGTVRTNSLISYFLLFSFIKTKNKAYSLPSIKQYALV